MGGEAPQSQAASWSLNVEGRSRSREVPGLLFPLPCGKRVRES